MNKVCEFPCAWHNVPERESNAVRLLMDGLGRRRGTKYERQSTRPDEAYRNKPAADFIYRDSKSGEQIAVEYTELNDPKVAEASSLLAHDKRLQRRGDIRPSDWQGEQSGFTAAKVYPQDFASVDRFIAKKIRKGQYEYGFERDSVD